MITARTCLILGAGASAPYGLPPATALRDLILVSQVPGGASIALEYPILLPDGNFADHRTTPNISPEKKLVKAKSSWVTYLNRVCGEAGFSAKKLADFRSLFVRARRQSIDKFIQFNEEEYGDIGRLHIAAVLLNCERDFWLDKDWYAQLLDEIVPNGPDDLKDGMLSIVTFNYDRSFEFFFTTAFEAGFRLSAEDARKMFERIKLVHVYGQLGELSKTGYGEIKSVKQAAEEISLIRINEENPNKAVINRMIQDAENICFIGFAFAPENLALFDTKSFEGKTIIATSMGLSPNRKAETKKTLKRIKFLDGSASDLLHSQNIFGSKKAPKPEELPVRRGVRNNGVTVAGWR